MKAITTRYRGPTNARGSRVSAFTTDQSITLGYDDALNSEANHTNAALALCHKMRWGGELVRGDLTNGDCVFVFLPKSKEIIKISLSIKGAHLVENRQWITLSECPNCRKFHAKAYHGGCYDNPSESLTLNEVDALRDAFPQVRIATDQLSADWYGNNEVQA